LLLIAYMMTLLIGFLLIPSPEKPIADPMFTILEMLIIAMMPVMLLLLVSAYAWSAKGRKALGLGSVR
jgi:cytochrome bd-type quinol oxidase subunit 2